jgi:hypothetical protein
MRTGLGLFSQKNKLEIVLMFRKPIALIFADGALTY